MPYPFIPRETLTAENLNAALDMRMFASGAGIGFVPGALIFGHATNGGFQTDAANLTFDNINDRLGVRTNAPQAMLHVGKFAGSARVYNSFIDPANGEWSYLGDWAKTPGVATYGTDKAGTGFTRNVQFTVGGINKLDYGVTNTAQWTMRDPDPASGRYLTVGASIPMYVYAGAFTFNTYWNGVDHYQLGPGSSNHYGGIYEFRTDTGTHMWWITEQSGGAGANVQPDISMSLRRVGGYPTLVLGDWADFTSSQAGWRRNGAENQSVLADVNAGYADFRAKNMAAQGGSYWWSDVAAAQWWAWSAGNGVAWLASNSSIGTYLTVDFTTGLFNVSGGALKLTSTRVSNSAPLDVDTQGASGVAAKFGATTPVYLFGMGIGFNSYNSGARWEFGKGSVAGQYAGLHTLDIYSGTHYFASSWNSGAAGTEAGNVNTFAVNRIGMVSLGEGVSFNNTFPALKRSGAELQVRLGDDSNWAYISALTAPPGTSNNQLATTAFVSNLVGTTAALYLPLAGGRMSGGINFGNMIASGGATDTSRHITLWEGGYGFSITGGTLNYITGGQHHFIGTGTSIAQLMSSGTYINVPLIVQPASATVYPLDIIDLGTNGHSVLRIRNTPSGWGLSFDPFWPGVSFNSYHDGVSKKAYSNDFSGAFFLNPSNGTLTFSSGNAPGKDLPVSETGRLSLTATGFIGINHDNPIPAQSLAVRGAVWNIGATVRSYNTMLTAANGEWAYMGDWAGNIARYGTDQNGTGLARDVQIMRGGSTKIQLAPNNIYFLEQAIYWHNPLAATQSMIMNCGITGQQSNITWQDVGNNLWQIGKQADNSWFTYNVSTGGSPFRVSTAGLINLGESSQITIPRTGIPTIAGATFDPGINFGTIAVSSPSDLSRHIALYSPDMGFSITGYRLNYYVNALSNHVFVAGANVDVLTISNTARVGIKNFTPQADLHVGSNAGTARVYNSYVDANNSEWAYLGSWANNVALYGTSKNGTGATRNVAIQVGGISRLEYGAAVGNPDCWMINGNQLVLNNNLPLYLFIQGFSVNHYYNGANFIYGPGSANNYASTFDFSTTSGQWRWWMSSTPGNGGASADVMVNMVLKRGPNGALLALGDWADHTNAFPALRRNGNTLEVRLGDDSAYAPFRASSVTADTLIGGSVGFPQGQWLMSGGGNVFWEGPGGRLSWSSRFIIIPLGISNTVGYFQFYQPTTDIPASQCYDGVARSATAAGIVLNSWEALYAVCAIGSGADPNAYSYRIVNSLTVPYTVNSNWILIAAINGDTFSAKLGSGAILFVGDRLTGGGYENKYIWNTQGPPQAANISLSSSWVRNYHTFTDAANTDGGYLGELYAGTVLYGSFKYGTGIARDVQILRGGAPFLYFKSGALQLAPLLRYEIGDTIAMSALARTLYVRDQGGDLPQTAGGYLYPFEYVYQAGNYVRLQMAGYRRFAGAGWTGSGYRIQASVDSSFLDGTLAYVELGSNAAGAGRLHLSAGGYDSLSITAAAGYVGIKNTTPGVLLDVTAQPNQSDTIRISNTLVSGPGTSVGATVESIGVRGDGNGSFDGRFGVGFRRTDGSPIDNGYIGRVGTFAFGGQWGTDQTYQAAKMLYPASVQGIVEGAYTAANAMPTALSFRTGSVGEDIRAPNTSFGIERIRVASGGNVGIGDFTTSSPPQANLHVGGGTIPMATARAYWWRPSSTDGEWAYMGSWSGANGGTVQYGSDKSGTGVSKPFQFLYGGTDVLNYAITNAAAFTFGGTYPIVINTLAAGGYSRIGSPSAMQIRPQDNGANTILRMFADPNLVNIEAVDTTGVSFYRQLSLGGSAVAISGSPIQLNSTTVVGLSGLTSGNPALKRVSSTLQIRLGDDSGFAPLMAGNITASTGASFYVDSANASYAGANGTGYAAWAPLVTTNAYSTSALNGDAVLRGSGGTATLILQSGSGGANLALKGVMVGIGGNTAAFPGLKANGTELQVRLADDSADGNFSAQRGTFTGGIYAGTNIIATGVANPNGQIQMYPGGTGNTGYIGWMKPNNTRQAYMGFRNDRLSLFIEQDQGLQIVGNVCVGGEDQPVRPLTAWKAATNDPIEVKVDQGYYARITYHQKNIRIWSCGQNAASEWMLADESAGLVRWTVRTNGIAYANVAYDTPVYYSGGRMMSQVDATHHYLYRPDGSTALYLSQDYSTCIYYRGNQHRFDSNGATNWLVLDGNINVNSGNIYMNSGGYIFLNNTAYLSGKDTAGNGQVMIGMGSDNQIHLANNGHVSIFHGQISTTNHIWPNANNNQYCGYNVGPVAWFMVTSYQFVNPSDQREKKDIRSLPDRCLDLVNSIIPKRFRWNHGLDQERTHWGFIAQEVGETMQKAGLDFGGHIVADDEKRSESLGMNELVAVLWRAVQELSERLQLLEAKEAA
jgi:hypothetical protein